MSDFFYGITKRASSEEQIIRKSQFSKNFISQRWTESRSWTKSPEIIIC